MKAFNSRYDGTCKICLGKFSKGTEIVWNRSVKGQVAHYTCFTNAGETFPASPTTTTILTDNNDGTFNREEKVTVNKTATETTYQSTSNDLASVIAAAVAPLVKVQREEIVSTVLDVIETLGLKNAGVKTIEIKNVETGEVKDMGIQHKLFPDLLTACQSRDVKGNRLNFWLAGPAGTGKTTAAESVGRAMSLERVVVLPKLSESYSFFGYHIPGTGEYKRTPARDVWEFGGMLVLDDFDGTDPNTATELMAPLANGMCMFPDGMVPRHADCIIILTANTWGHGATNEYVGRLKQDAAFMDRFISFEWPIDEEMETATAGNPTWTKRVHSVRSKVAQKGIKVLVTPRASYFGAALLAAGMSQDKVESMILKKGMTDDQWQRVR